RTLVFFIGLARARREELGFPSVDVLDTSCEKRYYLEEVNVFHWLVCIGGDISLAAHGAPHFQGRSVSLCRGEHQG
ncbi:unnamed protein product, partial [Pleuronectes platessa]